MQKQKPYNVARRAEKNKSKEHKLDRKRSHADNHWALTNMYDVPRRVNGNKLGLRRRFKTIETELDLFSKGLEKPEWVK